MNKLILKIVIFGLSTLPVYSQSELSSDSEIIEKKAQTGASKGIKESNPLETRKVEKEKPATSVVKDESSNGNRYGLHGSFSYLDTWLPGKLGLTLSYGDKDRTYELAYQSASYSFDVIIDDLGKISDQRIHLSTRSHTWGGSLNFQYGAYYNKFSAELGNAYTELLGGKYDIVEVQTLGVLWGVGNKWRWNSWEFSTDWFKVFWPITKLSENSDFLDESDDDSDKDDIEELLDTVSSIPTFSLFHVELGYRF